MKIAMYKCALCSKTIEKDDVNSAVPYKGRFVHRNCMDEFIRGLSDAKKQEQAKKATKKRRITEPIVIKETVKPVSESESQSKKAFHNQIERITGGKARVEHNAYAKRLMKEYDLTFDDLSMALEYHYVIRERELPEGVNLLGIVPYVVEDAKRYFKKLDEAIALNSKMDTTNFYSETRITITKPETSIAPIDFSQLGIGDA